MHLGVLADIEKAREEGNLDLALGLEHQLELLTPWFGQGICEGRRSLARPGPVSAGTDWSHLPLSPLVEVRGLDAVRLLVAFEDAARARGWSHDAMIEAEMTILDGLELFEEWYADRGRLIDASPQRRPHLRVIPDGEIVGEPLISDLPATP